MTREATWPLHELTMAAAWRRQVAAHAEKPYLHWLPDGRRWSYREADAAINRLANGLLAEGVSHGTHVALFAENSPEHLFAFCALGKIGAVAVPVNTACRGEVLRYYLDQSDATALLVSEDLADRIAALGPLPHLRRTVLLPSAGAACALPGIPCAALMQASDAPPDTAVKPSDLAMLAYTSGTTGPSKGCMHSQASSLIFGLSNAETHGHRADDVFYVCLPLFHMNALQTQSLCALLVGGSVALSSRFSVSQFWPEVRASGATITNLLGSMAAFLWAAPEAGGDRDNRLRMVSATPLPKFAEAFEQRFGLKLVSNYGLSDYAMATGFTTDAPAEKRGSAGRARDGIEIRIVDDDDAPLPAGQPGEILLRSNRAWGAAGGYWKMPAATLEATRNLWFHTGDRGILDTDGYLWFVDRKKDSIRRRGENISAYEVEQIVARHPAVAEAAAFAIPAETSEDEVAVAVILKPGSTLAEAELLAHCVANMTYFMVPRFIRFVAEFPRTPSQKVEKHRLKTAAAEDRSPFWDRVAAGIEVRR